MGEISGSYLEQDVLNQQDRVPIRNVVVGVPGRDGKREHAVPQELRIAHRHESSVQGSRSSGGRGTGVHIGCLHGDAGRRSSSCGIFVLSTCKVGDRRTERATQMSRALLFISATLAKCSVQTGGFDEARGDATHSLIGRSGRRTDIP